MTNNTQQKEILNEIKEEVKNISLDNVKFYGQLEKSNLVKTIYDYHPLQLLLALGEEDGTIKM